MALISKDNEQNASVCETTYPNERVINDHHYSKMFISCTQIQQSLGDYGAALKGLWKELKIDKSTKINIE